MPKVSYAVKLEPRLVQNVKRFCHEHGVKQGFFVDKALKDSLEKEEMLEDLRELKLGRGEEENAVSFEEYLKRRKVDHG